MKANIEFMKANIDYKLLFSFHLVTPYKIIRL
jgi:hypothetical protein